MENFEIKRELQQFGIGENKRKYIVVTATFSVARQLFSAERYRAETGIGEQRELVLSHVRVLRKEIEEGNFTPASVAVSIKDGIEPVFFEDNGVQKVFLTIKPGQTLPLIDGGHRFAALEYILETTKNESVIRDIEASSVTALIMLDGNSKKDFLNLQKGRAVDKSHIQSLSIQEKFIKSKDVDMMTFAYETAKCLNKHEKSPFFNQIRFDSAGVSGLPIASLIGKGASDIATSIVGGAKIAMKYGKTPEWLCKCIVTSYMFAKDKSPDLFEPGRKLCPPPNGTKGSATMLIGIGNILAYRLMLKNEDVAGTTDIEQLVEACNMVFKGNVNGNYSGPIKRDMIGKFTELFIKDLNAQGDTHYGIPKGLVRLLGSTSTFSLPKLEREKKVKPKKVKKVKKKKSKKEKVAEEQKELFDDADYEKPVAKVESKPIQEIDQNGNNVYTVDTKPEDAPWEKTDVAPWEIDS